MALEAGGDDDNDHNNHNNDHRSGQSQDPPPPPHIGGVVLGQGLEVAAADGVYVALARQAEGEVGRPNHVLALGVGAEGRQEEEPRILSYYLFRFRFRFQFRFSGSVSTKFKSSGGGEHVRHEHRDERGASNSLVVSGSGSESVSCYGSEPTGRISSGPEGWVVLSSGRRGREKKINKKKNVCRHRTRRSKGKQDSSQVSGEENICSQERIEVDRRPA